jgi:hypothetical protein
MEQANLGDVFKKASRSVCTSAVVISPDPFLVLYPINFFSSEDS